MKKLAILMSALTFCVLNGACVTPYMLKETAKHEYYFEEDRLSAFLMSVDGKQLIIIGQHYHYIFPLENSLKDVLKADRKGYDVYLPPFELKKDQQIEGEVTFALPKEVIETLNPLQIKQYEGIGFKQSGTSLVYRKALLGHIYRAGSFKLPNTPATAFLKMHKVAVRIDNYSTAKRNLQRALLTPLTVTADGLIVVGTIVAVTVIKPIVTIYEAIKYN